MTGEVWDFAGVRCKSNDCSACSVWKARRIEDAIHLAQPEWLLTLGPIDRSPKRIPAAVRGFRQRLRRSVSGALQDAYFVEPYTQRGDLHLHMYLWGAALTDDTVLRAALASGLADATHYDLQPITHHGDLGYGLKMIHSPKSDSDRADFLEANEGRLVHATHRFWRGPDGAPARGGYAGAIDRVRKISRASVS